MIQNRNQFISPLTEETNFEKQKFFLSCKKLRIETNTCFYGCFYLGPFDPGQSLTIANALRRTLLSELKGIAITAVEIEGAFHEYSILPGIQDSVLDILLNLKEVILKKKSLGLSSKNLPIKFSKTQVGYLRARGPGIVKAADLRLPPFLQCVNPEQYIATLSDDGFLNLKILINEGKNYHIQKPSKPGSARNLMNSGATRLANSNPLLIDAIFMPVLKVNYIIESNEQANDFVGSSNISLVPLEATPVNLVPHARGNKRHEVSPQGLSDIDIKGKGVLDEFPKTQLTKTNSFRFPLVKTAFLPNTNSIPSGVGQPPADPQGLPAAAIKGKDKTVKFRTSSFAANINKSRITKGRIPNLFFGQNVKHTIKKSTLHHATGNKMHQEVLVTPLQVIKGAALQSKAEHVKNNQAKINKKSRLEAAKRTLVISKNFNFWIPKECVPIKFKKSSKNPFTLTKTKTAQSKIDLKHNIVLEIWTNGSLHPREALYKSIKNLLSVFSKLKQIKFLGSIYKSEKNYKKFLDLFVKKWKNQIKN